jgi:hypothetical protein
MMHLERHMYKKGKNKGDAPADKNKRRRDYHRVVKNNDGTMAVRLFGTDILTAHHDGTVRINTDGWYDRRLTVLRLNESFGFFTGVSVGMRMQQIFSHNQPTLSVNGKKFSYYDGITLSEQGEILTPLRAFEQKRIDKAESKDFSDGLQESGFKGAFKILYATTTPEHIGENNYELFGVDWNEVLTDSERADKWQMMIARIKFHRYYSYHQGKFVTEEKADAKACWANIMQYCKKNMYVVSRSETFVL